MCIKEEMTLLSKVVCESASQSLAKVDWEQNIRRPDRL